MGFGILSMEMATKKPIEDPMHPKRRPDEADEIVLILREARRFLFYFAPLSFLLISCLSLRLSPPTRLQLCPTCSSPSIFFPTTLIWTKKKKRSPNERLQNICYSCCLFTDG